MEEDRETGSPKGDDGPADRRKEAEDAFDMWLHRRLHQLYDSVTREPIPPELLELIEKHRTRRAP